MTMCNQSSKSLKTVAIALYLAIFVFPIDVVFGETTGKFGLENAVQVTLERHIKIAVLQKQIEKLKIEIQVASRIFRRNPEIEGAVKNRRTSDKQSLIDFEVSINLPVEIRNQRQYRQKIAEIKLRVAEYELQKQKMEIASNLKDIFSELNILKEKAKILKEKLRVEEELLEYMKTKAKHGEISQVELNIAKLDVSNTREIQLSLKQKTLAKKIELELLLNQEIPQDIEFVFDAPAVSDFPDIYSITNYAKKNNPRIKIASLYVDMASAKERLIKAESVFHKLTPSIVYSREDKENILGVRLGIPLPILNRKKEEIHIAQADKDINISQKQDIQYKVISELKKDYESLNIFWEKKKVYDNEILPVVQQNMDDIKKLYQKGEIDFTAFEHFMDNRVKTRLTYLDFLRKYYHIIFQIELLSGDAIGNIINKKQTPGGIQ